MPELERHRTVDGLPRSGAKRLISLVSVVLSLSIVSATVTAPAKAATRSSQQTVASATTATPITLANAALARAVLQIKARQIYRAKLTLASLRTYVRRAHYAAMAQIGKPPADPESDDPPGPPAVIADTALEHRVTAALVPLYNGRRRHDMVGAMSYTLSVTHNLRQLMLTKVTGLDPEGDGSDYADSMSDTLVWYPAEVTLVTTALRTYRLTSYGRYGLNHALVRVRLANATMNAAYGGGE
jgi:hypothetical protein